MIRSASTTVVSNKTSQVKTAESSLQGAEHLSEQIKGAESGLAAGFTSSKKGFDFAQVPATPALQTGLSVQCCAKDGKPCSCSKCKAKAESEEESGSNNLETKLAAAVSAPVSDSATPAVKEQTVDKTGDNDSQTSRAEESTQPQSALLVDQSSEGLQEGQMTKNDFLTQLRESICRSIDPVLATVGQTTDGCPYLNYWLDLYAQKTAAEIEQTVHRYAPGSAKARTAGDYISTVTSRALRAAVVWATTGRITGVPEGISTTVPGEPPAEQTGNSKPGPAGTTATLRGAKKANEPVSIQQQLGQGSSLPSSVSSRMESAFGTSFSNVRTHTDTNAIGISNRLNARAFTVGNHVAFGSGEFQPGTLIGDALIAHELAHVVQQSHSEKSVDKMENGSTSYNALEQDADRAAAGAISSLWSGTKNGLKGIAQRAMPMLRSGISIQQCSKTSGGPCSTAENQTLTTAKQTAGTWVTAALAKLRTTPVPAAVTTSLRNNFGPTDGIAANLPGITTKIVTANTEMTTVPVSCAGTEDSTCASACGYTPFAGAHRFVICRNKSLTPTTNPDFTAGCVLHESFHSAFSDFSGDSYSGWGGISSSTAGYPGSAPLTNSDSYTSLVIDLK